MPLVAAVLMSEVRPPRALRALAYLPVVVPPVVAVLLWKRSTTPSREGRLQHDPRLGRHWAVPVAAVERWRCRRWCSRRPGRPPARTVIIYLAALIGGHRELYDAAEVDGASVWRKVWHVTLPQLRGVLLITLILQIIGTAQVFLEPYLFTKGGPDNATVTILLLIYNYAFGNARRRLRRGDGAQPDARGLPRPPLRSSTSGATRSWSSRDATPRAGAAGAATLARASGCVSPPTGGARRALGVGAAQLLLLVLLVVVASGRCCWLAKSAFTPTQDTLTQPMALFPNGSAWSNLTGLDRASTSATTSEHGRARARLVVHADPRRDDRRLRALGAAAASTRKLAHGPLLATLFVPAVVLLVPLYIEIVASAARSTTRSSTTTGRCGCRPARAPSTSCS